MQDDKAAEYAELAALYKQALNEGADPTEARSAYDNAVRAVATRAAATATPAAQKQSPGVLQTIGDFAKMGGGAAGIAAAAQNPIIRGVGQEVVQGATSGGADELMGIADPAAAQSMRQDRMAFNKEHPVMAMGANLVGNAVPMALTGGLAGGGGIAAKVAKILGTGTGSGALTGALESDGEGADRATGAMQGAALGAVGGAVAAGVGKVGQGIARRFWGATGANAAERRATSRVVSKLDGQRITPDLLPQVAGSNKGVDARMLDVMGDPGERMARGVNTMGGEGGEKMQGFVAKRLGSYQDRMGEAIGNAVAPVNIPKTVEGFNKTRSSVSGPLYDAFRSEGKVASDELDRLFNLPQFKKALPIAEELMAGKPEAPSWTFVTNANGQQVKKRLYTPEYLDNVKKAMDDVIYRGRQPGEGGVGPAQLRAMKDKRKEFVEFLDRIYPDTYKPAREAWSGVTATKEAFENGQEVFSKRMNPDAIEELTQHLPPSDRDVFMQGAASELVRQIEEGGIKPGTTEHRAFIKRIEQTFGDKTNEILSSIRDEVTAQRTGARVMGKSDTAERLTDVIDAIAPERSNLWEAGAFNPERGIRGLVGKGVRDFGSKHMFSKTRSALADILLAPQDDQEVLRRIAREVEARKIGQATKKAVRMPIAMQTTRGFLMNREE